MWVHNDATVRVGDYVALFPLTRRYSIPFMSLLQDIHFCLVISRHVPLVTDLYGCATLVYCSRDECQWSFDLSSNRSLTKEEPILLHYLIRIHGLDFTPVAPGDKAPPIDFDLCCELRVKYTNDTPIRVIIDDIVTFVLRLRPYSYFRVLDSIQRSMSVGFCGTPLLYCSLTGYCDYYDDTASNFVPGG